MSVSSGKTRVERTGFVALVVIVALVAFVLNPSVRQVQGGQEGMSWVEESGMPFHVTSLSQWSSDHAGYVPFTENAQDVLLLAGFGDSACPPCIDEIFDYHRVIDSLDLHHVEFGIVLLGSDSLRGEGLHELIGFPGRKFRSANDSLTAELTEWGGRYLDSQLSLVRLKQDSIVVQQRIAILNANTPDSHKLGLLQDLDLRRPSNPDKPTG